MAKLQGTDNFLANVRTWADGRRRAALRAVEDAAEQIMSEARDLCPVDTHNLQNSGTISRATVEGDSIVVRFGFNATSQAKDGSLFDYGIYVHEHTGMNFSTDRNPRAQAKFLALPLLRWRYRLKKHMAEAMADV